MGKHYPENELKNLNLAQENAFENKKSAFKKMLVKVHD